MSAAYDARPELLPDTGSASVTPANADVHNLYLRSMSPGAAAAVKFDPANADSAYAFSAVGQALVMALSEAASRRPADPIEFVAQRLINYRQTVDHCRERDAEVEEFRQARIRQLAEEARQRAIQEELRLQRELEERRKREELERLRLTVPLATFAAPPPRLSASETRNKAGATPLHTAVRAGCDVETLLRLLHEGHSFCARDGQGFNVREAAAAAKNDAVVKEIDSMVLRWIREEKLDYLRWLVAADYGGSFPSLKKAFGPKLKGLPDASRALIDAIPQTESRFRELWKLSARGTREHLESHCRQLKEQRHAEDPFARSREGLTAMHVALLCKNPEAARFLAAEFPGLLEVGDNFGRLPIHYAHAAGQNFVEMVRAAPGPPGEPLDAFGFAPSVYAKRYELLPEPPSYGSPDLLVTGEADEDGAEGEDSASASATAAATATGGETEGGDGADGGGEGKEDPDQSKLTPINEDEGED